MQGALIQHLLLSHPASSTLMGAGSPTSSPPTHQGSHMWASTEAAAFLWCQTQTTISLFLACLLQVCNLSSDYTRHTEMLISPKPASHIPQSSRGRSSGNASQEGRNNNLLPYSVTKGNRSGYLSGSQGNQAILILSSFDDLVIATAGNSDYSEVPLAVGSCCWSWVQNTLELIKNHSCATLRLLPWTCAYRAPGLELIPVHQKTSKADVQLSASVAPSALKLGKLPTFSFQHLPINEVSYTLGSCDS